MYQEVGCKAGLSWCKGVFTEFGDHAAYHEQDHTYIANIIFENTVKVRCAEEHRPIKDIFDEEVLK